MLLGVLMSWGVVQGCWWTLKSVVRVVCGKREEEVLEGRGRFYRKKEKRSSLILGRPWIQSLHRFMVRIRRCITIVWGTIAIHCIQTVQSAQTAYLIGGVILTSGPVNLNHLLWVWQYSMVFCNQEVPQTQPGHCAHGTSHSLPFMMVLFNPTLCCTYVRSPGLYDCHVLRHLGSSDAQSEWESTLRAGNEVEPDIPCPNAWHGHRSTVCKPLKWGS